MRISDKTKISYPLLYIAKKRPAKKGHAREKYNAFFEQDPEPQARQVDSFERVKVLGLSIKKDSWGLRPQRTLEKCDPVGRRVAMEDVNENRRVVDIEKIKFFHFFKFPNRSIPTEFINKANEKEEVKIKQVQEFVL